jgi:hypothetical protein
MSQSEFPKEGTGGGPNTWIIIVAVVVVVAICGFCVCGGVLGIAYWRVAPMEALPQPLEAPQPSPAAPDWESPADESDSD